MISQFKKAVSTAAVTVALAAPLSMAGMVVTADAAFAAGNGNGGRSASRGGNRSDRGRMASTLKNLNAANAFKNGNVPAAVEQAPDSNIGQIGSLQLAVADTVAAAEAMEAAETATADFLAAVSAEYDEEGNLIGYDEDAYAALVAGTDDEATAFEDYLAGLEQAEIDTEEAYLTAVSMEEEALMTASGGNDFDYYGGYESDTLVYLRGLLGFGS